MDSVTTVTARPFLDVFRDRRVLVTGHTGFKGSWLTLWLLGLGAKVTGLSAYLPSTPCNFQLLRLENRIDHVVADVRDFQVVSATVRRVEPEFVFHLAAQPLVRTSIEQPRLTFESNVLGTVNVLDAIRGAQSVRSAVIVTSDKCYRNSEWVWGYRENDPLGGDDPYSASKAAAELAIHSYSHSYFRAGGPRISSARAGNVIGGGDWAENRVVPDCIRAWSAGEEVMVRNPGATRPWQHVLEPLSGYLWLAAQLANGEVPGGQAFNFGPRAETTQPVGELIRILSGFWPGAGWRVADNADKVESTLLALSCDKARDVLKWRAVLGLETTLEMTAKWYLQHRVDPNALSDFSVSQIDSYIAAAQKSNVGWSVPSA